MQITFKTSTMYLEDEPLEEGYASEKVVVKPIGGKETEIIGGQNGRTQLIISLPFIDDKIVSELNHITATLDQSPLIDVKNLLIVANAENKALDAIKGFELYEDIEGEFGDMYSVRLVDGSLEGELSKALFVISKDGALFYDEIVPELSSSFNSDKVISKIAVAQECYTGKGCH